ncbi:MAG: Lactoylglutathione lyase and related lyases, partial [uncultured Lysobacter sp.]
ARVRHHRHPGPQARRRVLRRTARHHRRQALHGRRDVRCLDELRARRRARRDISVRWQSRDGRQRGDGRAGVQQPRTGRRTSRESARARWQRRRRTGPAHGMVLCRVLPRPGWQQAQRLLYQPGRL